MRRRPRRHGGVIARVVRRTLPQGPLLLVAILALDQLTKWLVLARLEVVRSLEITPFFNLVLVWNTGISFGMLNWLPTSGRPLIVLLTLGIAAMLVFWLRRERRTLPRLALWGIVGGAAGNLLDRLRHGAVVDFLDLHVAGHHWPAFNVADSAIVVGALILVLDGLFSTRDPVHELGESAQASRVRERGP